MNEIAAARLAFEEPLAEVSAKQSALDAEETGVEAMRAEAGTLAVKLASIIDEDLAVQTAIEAKLDEFAGELELGLPLQNVLGNFYAVCMREIARGATVTESIKAMAASHSCMLEQIKELEAKNLMHETAVEAANTKIRLLSTELPSLQGQKAAAVKQRNFKEAGRISKLLKSMCVLRCRPPSPVSYYFPATRTYVHRGAIDLPSHGHLSFSLLCLFPAPPLPCAPSKQNNAGRRTLPQPKQLATRA